MQTRTILRVVAGLMLAFFITAQAAVVSRVTTFSDGSILYASDLNSEFNNLVDNINALDNDNISSGAAIAPSKLSATIAGDGIARDGSGILSVGVDDVGIEISSDSLRLKAGGVAITKLAAQAAYTVIGNGTNASAVPTALAASTDGHVLRRSGTTVGFGTVAADGLASSSVTTAKIADAAVTQAKREALVYQISDSSGSFTEATGSFTDVTNLSVTITTTGRPVWVGLIPDGSGNCSVGNTGTTTSVANLKMLRGASTLGVYALSMQAATTSSITSINVPCSAVSFFDTGASAGSTTYKLQMQGGSTTGRVSNARLAAYEL